MSEQQYSDDELRGLVREAIARRLDRGRLPESSVVGRHHVSHAKLPLESGDSEGACLIEPAVRCNHCGYCLSLGH